MIEKEAEIAWNKRDMWFRVNADESVYKEGFKDGYQKANEWHYPLRLDENDNPIADNPIAESYPVEICMYDFNSGNREIIKYDTAWGYYRKDGSSISQNHIAWQYLSSIPPKEA